MSRHDVIVIGGGHNGLVTAGLLARRGLDVVVSNAVSGRAGSPSCYPPRAGCAGR